MNKTIKEYAGCVIPAILFICFIAYLFYMNNDGDKQQKPTVGKYLYVDVNETIHLRRNCRAIGSQTGENGEADRTVTRIPVSEVTTSMLDCSCSRCISDEAYDELMAIIYDNE